ncbi:MAG: glycosyltransferase [Cycloclasticus sp.]|nr:glycosyltransferase [Cycloclasticus sp.]MBQ0789877.1 glycosyltransferase [Cycloclasticus sp.]
MKVLIIASLWPEPTSSAAGRRMVSLLELFHAQGWSLTYACTAAESEHCYPFEGLSIKAKKIAVNDSAFDQMITELSPDIVLYDRFMVEEQFSWRVEKQCPTALTILETSDLHSLRSARQGALKLERDYCESDLVNDVAYREIASIQRTDLSLIISNYEMHLLTSFFKIDGALIHYFPFIVDPEISKQHRSVWPGYEQRQGFMSIGNFKHAPNWDCVQYLKQTIWPLIRQQLPSAELFVYGAYPPAKAMQLNKPADGFYIKGRADDAKQVMQAARVCLAPLRFGAGLKGKLLEAMEFGTPSVTSTIGAEGMHHELPWNGEVTDEPDGFAKAAVSLHEDKLSWQEAQTKGSDILRKCFAPDVFETALIAKIIRLKETLGEHRLQNFRGGMLKHHLLKSTKYMSLWIEQKNKQSE